MDKISEPREKRPVLYEVLTDYQYEPPKLNLGCGFIHLKDCYNIDNNSECQPDYLMDLEKPLVFDANSINYVCAINVLEHIHNFLSLLAELYRICKEEAVLEFIVPYCFNQAAFEDPTHVRFFGPSSWQYWQQKTYEGEKTNTAWPEGLPKFNFQLEGVKPLIDETIEIELKLLKQIKDPKTPAQQLIEHLFWNYCTNSVHWLFYRLKKVPLLKGKTRTIRILD